MDTTLQLAQTHHQLADAKLRGLVRHKLFSGILLEAVEHDALDRVSSGSTCNACDLPIRPGSPEIQTFGVDQMRQRYHHRYHSRCHLMLSTELEDLAQR
jgi:hypothetical protein